MGFCPRLLLKSQSSFPSLPERYSFITFLQVSAIGKSFVLPVFFSRKRIRSLSFTSLIFNSNRSEIHKPLLMPKTNKRQSRKLCLVKKSFILSICCLLRIGSTHFNFTASYLVSLVFRKALRLFFKYTKTGNIMQLCYLLVKYR